MVFSDFFDKRPFYRINSSFAACFVTKQPILVYKLKYKFYLKYAQMQYKTALYTIINGLLFVIMHSFCEAVLSTLLLF